MKKLILTMAMAALVAAAYAGGNCTDPAKDKAGCTAGKSQAECPMKEKCGSDKAECPAQKKCEGEKKAGADASEQQK